MRHCLPCLQPADCFRTLRCMALAGRPYKKYVRIMSEGEKLYFVSCLVTAASINPRKSGCGRFGRDLSSGCACVPMKNG